MASTTHPRKLRGTKEEHFVRVAAGKAHSLALTGSGRLYSFGAGTFGALGLSCLHPCRGCPCLVASTQQLLQPPVSHPLLSPPKREGTDDCWKPAPGPSCLPWLCASGRDPTSFTRAGTVLGPVQGTAARTTCQCRA